MANYSRWDDVKKKRRAPTTETRAGIEQDFAQILADIRERDHRDTTRAAAPLRKAEGATEIVSDAMEKEQVVGRICEIARQAEGSAGD